MERPDLNLLYALAVLLEEQSVVRASTRLGLSSSATSRQLARLRELTGDPLLVRAGRALVPTPRALAMAEQVRTLVDEGSALLRAQTLPELGSLDRTFHILAGEGFVETFGGALLTAIERAAPGVSVHFHPWTEHRTEALRRGEAEVSIGVWGHDAGPELRTTLLLRDRFVGVVHPEHPLASGPVTAQTYATSRHVETHRHAAVHPNGRIDRALHALGLHRHLHTVVAGFASALALCRSTQHVASVPERHTAGMRDGLVTFDLPLDLPEIAIAMTWHPRHQVDPAHRWLREVLQQICTQPR